MTDVPGNLLPDSMSASHALLRLLKSDCLVPLLLMTELLGPLSLKTVPLVLCLRLLLLIELSALHPRMSVAVYWQSLFALRFQALLIAPRVPTIVVVQQTASGRDLLTAVRLHAHLCILPALSLSLVRLRASLNHALALDLPQGPTSFVLLMTRHRETATCVRRIGLSLVGLVATADPM